MYKSGLKAAGFTIVETLIVLAVTGGLFVAIAATLAGRQNAAEFTHAIQSTQSQIQQTIDQVSAGFYPNQNNFTCASVGGSLQISIGSNTQGTNQDCVFLGKVIQFGVAGSNPEQYRVYTIAGLHCSTCIVGPTSPFQNVNPTVVGVNYTVSDAGLLNYSSSGTLQYGLSTLWVKVLDKSNNIAANVGTVGFLMEPGSLNTGTGNYNSGTQQVDLVPILNTNINPGQSPHDAANTINTYLNSINTVSNPNAVNPAGGVQICLVSSGTNQSGLITIGGSGRQLLVKLNVKNNKTCA
jgi:type II secretory pathway pseudopilin PulG